MTREEMVQELEGLLQPVGFIAGKPADALRAAIALLSIPSNVEIERARIRIQGTIDAFVAAMAPGALPDNPFSVAFRGGASQDIDAFKLALRGLDALARERGGTP